jgi:exonuclease VII small subunit
MSARERKYRDNLQELRTSVAALKSTTDKLNGALDTIDTEDSLAEQMVKKLESIMGE